MNQSVKKKACCDDAEPCILPADQSSEQMAALAWAIAHPARVRIVRLLISRNACVCGEIVDEIPLAQSTVSQHPKILKESGLVQGEVDGHVVSKGIYPSKEMLQMWISGNVTSAAAPVATMSLPIADQGCCSGSTGCC